MSFIAIAIVLFFILFHFSLTLYGIYKYNSDNVNAFNRFILFFSFSIHSILITLSLNFQNDLFDIISAAFFIILAILLYYCDSNILITYRILKRLGVTFAAMLPLLWIITFLIDRTFIISTQALVYTLSIAIYLLSIFRITIKKISIFLRGMSLIEGMITVYHLYYFITFSIIWWNQCSILIWNEAIVEQWKLFLMVIILVISLGLAWILSILEEIKEKAIYQSYHDDLTGIANRRYLFEYGEKWFSRDDIEALCLFDLDNFKAINDTYGHAAGDHVLKHVASLIEKKLSDDCIFARAGGEEFCLILRRNSEVDAMSLVENLRHQIEQSVIEIDDEIQLLITASFGICHTWQGCKNIDILMQEADKCMYIAKTSGRNRIIANYKTD